MWDNGRWSLDLASNGINLQTVRYKKIVDIIMTILSVSSNVVPHSKNWGEFVGTGWLYARLNL